MFLLLLICLLAFSWSSSISIDDFGTIPNQNSVLASLTNANAFKKGLEFVHKKATVNELIIPNNTYYMLKVEVEHLTNIIISLHGNIVMDNHVLSWGDIKGKAMITFSYCKHIQIIGNGGMKSTNSLLSRSSNYEAHSDTTLAADVNTDPDTGNLTNRWIQSHHPALRYNFSVIDGQGLAWWRLTYTGHELRPRLIEFQYSHNITVQYITLLNAPTYHIYFHDCSVVKVDSCQIFVDSYIERIGGRDSVTYPLNTDGLDIMATNVIVRNNNITSYDDAVVFKPCRGSGIECTCSGNAVVENNSIYYSTGLAVGSVPPNLEKNCVHNVVFRNVTMYRPFKAIYVKSNPGTEGTGLIENIRYQDITIEQALWWTIWIGPQQQNQPGGSGTGCSFLYPFVPTCPTQPLVTMRNVSLQNIFASKTIPIFEGPGVVLCDMTNPCTHFVFNNVTNNMWDGNITDFFEDLPVPAPQALFPTRFRSDNWTFEYIIDHAFGRSDNCEPTVYFSPRV